MTDTYQAVYDAVRSKISNGDVGRAVAEAMRDANLSHYAEMAMRSAQEAMADFDSAWFRAKTPYAQRMASATDQATENSGG